MKSEFRKRSRRYQALRLSLLGFSLPWLVLPWHKLANSLAGRGGKFQPCFRGVCLNGPKGSSSSRRVTHKRPILATVRNWRNKPGKPLHPRTGQAPDQQAIAASDSSPSARQVGGVGTASSACSEGCGCGAQLGLGGRLSRGGGSSWSLPRGRQLRRSLPQVVVRGSCRCKTPETGVEKQRGAAMNGV